MYLGRPHSDALIPATHALIDHESLPGVLSETEHAAVDHTGFTGVGVLVQQKQATTSSLISTGGSNAFFDDTIPQFSEGTLILSVSITPKSFSNFLTVEFTCFAGTNGTGSIAVVHLHRDSIADALAASTAHAGETNASKLFHLRHTLAVPSLSSQTYQIVMGSTLAAHHFVNGDATGTTTGVRRFGGRAAATLTVKEVAP